MNQGRYRLEKGVDALNKKLSQMMLESLDVRLENIFKGQELDQQTIKYINEIKTFFRKKSQSALEYSTFITDLENVHQFQHNPVAAALIRLEERTPKRQQRIVLSNIGTGVGLVTLAILGAVFCAAAVPAGLTAACINPFLGIAMGIALLACGIMALYTAALCVKDFTSSKELKNEIKREKALLSFFAPKTQIQKPEPILSTSELDPSLQTPAMAAI